jgi:hypothetical protein
VDVVRRIYNQNETIAFNRRVPFVATWAQERQLIALNDIAAADSFTITWEGQTTASVAFAADMGSDIKTKLEALSNIEASDITVTKVSGVQSYSVDMGGSLSGTGIALMTLTPTGFTPTGVTRVGVQNAPATGLTFAAADIQVSKGGAANANSAGTVTEVAHGEYYYTAAQAEFDTRCTVTLKTVRTDIATTYMQIEVGGDVLRSFTAQAGAASTITLDASASSTSDFYLPCFCIIRKGTGVGQGPRYVSAYNGVTKVATVTPDWSVTPDSTTEAELIIAPPLASLTEISASVGSTVLGGEGVAIATDSAGRVGIGKHRSS